jgi:signal transduction histidine kinase
LDPPRSRLRSIATVATIAGAGVPLAALIGWMTGIGGLRQVFPGAIAMNPLTAIGLLASSMALGLAISENETRRRIRQALSALPVLLGGAILVAPPRPTSGVDLVLFKRQVLSLSPIPRVALSTALCLVAIGLALLLYRPGSRLHRLSRPLILPAAMFALLAATGYLYRAEWLFHIPALHPMGLNTSAALLLLCVGLAALPPGLHPMDRLVEDGVGGATARRLLPAAFLIPFALGYLRVSGERAGLFDLGFGTAAFVVLTAFALALLVLLTVKQVKSAEEAQARLTQALQDSERRTFRLLNGLPTGVFVVDAAGRPCYANEKSGEILGRGSLPDARPEDISERYSVYQIGSDVAYPPDRIPVVRAIGGEEVYASDLEIHRPDRIVPVEVWATPIRNDAGEIEFAVAAFNDITERLENQKKIDRLNSELEHQVSELAAVNQELETFSYSVSHDLRAPLRAVDGFSRVLETDYAGSLDPEALRYLSRIRRNVSRMGALIDDLLRFSRLSRQGLEAREVDMNSVVRNVVEDLSRSRPLTPVISIGELPPAHGDIDLLRQVWTNLLDNAIKYSGRKPDARIEITARAETGKVTYSVRDNGVGFDMAYADKLFGVFQRLHRQDEFEGTGVGLAIVHRVIHRHGGTIWAEAAPGQGAAFHFTLPTGAQNGGR